MASDSPILHLAVIGFHHKKGYQVDYSYPPLFGDKPNDVTSINECPAGWKYLPTLALPDGSHNFAEDTVYFNLPSLKDSRKTIYGISCYRQIPVEKLKIRTADVTRSTVQKAVCALVSRPLYGYIEVKLSLIAQSFFEQGDFSNTDIIRTAYDHLELCFNENKASLPLQLHVGLSLRDVVLRWKHKTLILFKLMLLQKKVVFFGSPVRPICTLILSILSLHPGLLETGYSQAACVKTSRPMSPMPEFPNDNEDDAIDKSIVDAIIDDEELLKERKVSVCFPERNHLNDNNGDKLQTSSLSRDVSVDALANSLQSLTNIDPSAWNAPLPIFTNGTLCLPYLSLPYMDLLTDPSVNGFIIGVSNILFRQKRQLMDVFIDIETSTIEASDPELRRQISLSTEDLRFIDFIVRNVQFPKEDAEGSEQWIRKQFHGYLLALVKTAAIAPDGSKDIEHFNGSFITTLRQTDSYISWLDDSKTGDFDFEQINSGHPFAGALSVGDMKLKIAQTMNNSESARKLNQAVNTTSKAVGGAISQAKGAFTNFWSTFTAPTATANIIPSDESQVPTVRIDNESIVNVDSDVNDDGVIKQLTKTFQGNEPQFNLNEEKDMGTNVNEGVVEIGREANLIDSNRSDVIDV